MPDSTDWLNQVQEETLEPGRRICDPHHHLWDRGGNRYLLDELLADTGSGHNIVSTVFIECLSMYRADGSEAMRPVGETEFVQGVAAMSASGGYGPMRACAGIIGFADLALGDAVAPVLTAHIDASANRFRGIRHAAGWHASADIRNSHTNPPEGLLMDAKFREGYAHLGRLGLTFEAWLYHPQIRSSPTWRARSRRRRSCSITSEGRLALGRSRENRKRSSTSGSQRSMTWRSARTWWRSSGD